jgi:fatty-acyl-CoA synthase
MIVSNDTGPRSGASTSAQAWMRALEATARIGEDPRRIFPAVINENAERFATAPALLSDRESMSYGELAGRARQYARWALDQKIAAGDVVALLMPNRPEFVAIWLGLTQIGAVVALLNTRLVGDSLAHCLAIAGPDHVIVEAELADAVFEIALGDAPAPQVWLHGAERPGYERIDTAVARYGNHALSAEEVRPVTLSDPALFIYTSGTTGLPKAARVSHHRIMMWCSWFAGMTDARTEDRMYNCLPMYHSVGGIVAIGAMLVAGGSVVVAEKFSARRFWDDVRRWDCTLFQYIGELCRYLVTAPPQDHEAQHRLRLCCGNGLRADIWTAFQERFQIPQILEFYAATEGSFSLFNAEGKPGAIGRIPPFLAHRFPAALVKFDIERETPIRDEQGFCMRCGADEIGEAIGRLAAQEKNLAARFEGYTSAADSERKILHNVFAEGDAWFRTGDLMRRDGKGFFYFVDRIGDTFRWKGENVASLEIAEAICACPGVADASVYGVAVPDADGRAGMAALVVDPSFNLAALRAHLCDRLPDYARPLFLRIRSELDLTETFKQKKQQLIAEGYDPARVADALFFNDGDGKGYVPLDQTLFEALKAGRLRL